MQHLRLVIRDGACSPLGRDELLGRTGLVERCQAGPIRESLRQQLNLFFCQFRLAGEYAGNIASRLRQTFNIAARGNAASKSYGGFSSLSARSCNPSSCAIGSVLIATMT